MLIRIVSFLKPFKNIKLKLTLLLVNICFIYHVREAHDLHETRICTINTALEKNQSSINQHRIYITIQ